MTNREDILDAVRGWCAEGHNSPSRIRSLVSAQFGIAIHGDAAEALVLRATVPGLVKRAGPLSSEEAARWRRFVQDNPGWSHDALRRFWIMATKMTLDRKTAKKLLAGNSQ